MTSHPEPGERANRIPLSATTASVRAAAFRTVLKRTASREEEDTVLFMAGLHYQPDNPVRRHPIHGSRITTTEAP